MGWGIFCSAAGTPYQVTQAYGGASVPPQSSLSDGNPNNTTVSVPN